MYPIAIAIYETFLCSRLSLIWSAFHSLNFASSMPGKSEAVSFLMFIFFLPLTQILCKLLGIVNFRVNPKQRGPRGGQGRPGPRAGARALPKLAGRAMPGISGSRGSFGIPRPRGGVWVRRPARALTCDRNSLHKFTIFFHYKGPRP